MSIELKAITKKFGSLVANDSIDLKVAHGEIHAILGENGAGKSTLMNIVYGLVKADSGKIFVEDKEVSINEPADALKYGIGMVHQHFMLIPVFTVAENIALGREESRGVFLTLDEKLFDKSFDVKVKKFINFLTRLYCLTIKSKIDFFLSYEYLLRNIKEKILLKKHKRLKTDFCLSYKYLLRKIMKKILLKTNNKLENRLYFRAADVKQNLNI